jgi:hypothetical protein
MLGLILGLMSIGLALRFIHLFTVAVRR